MFDRLFWKQGRLEEKLLGVTPADHGWKAVTREKEQTRVFGLKWPSDVIFVRWGIGSNVGQVFVGFRSFLGRSGQLDQHRFDGSIGPRIEGNGSDCVLCEPRECFGARGVLRDARNASGRYRVIGDQALDDDLLRLGNRFGLGILDDGHRAFGDSFDLRKRYRQLFPSHIDVDSFEGRFGSTLNCARGESHPVGQFDGRHLVWQRGFQRELDPLDLLEPQSDRRLRDALDFDGTLAVVVGWSVEDTPKKGPTGFGHPFELSVGRSIRLDLSGFRGDGKGVAGDAKIPEREHT